MEKLTKEVLLEIKHHRLLNFLHAFYPEAINQFDNMEKDRLEGYE